MAPLLDKHANNEVRIFLNGEPIQTMNSMENSSRKGIKLIDFMILADKLNDAAPSQLRCRN